jgi:hypothetical protein
LKAGFGIAGKSRREVEKLAILRCGISPLERISFVRPGGLEG